MKHPGGAESIDLRELAVHSYWIAKASRKQFNYGPHLNEEPGIASSLRCAQIGLTLLLHYENPWYQTRLSASNKIVPSKEPSFASPQSSLVYAQDARGAPRQFPRSRRADEIHPSHSTLRRYIGLMSAR